MNNNQIIKIRGAKVNNLKNINLDIPKFKFIVVTGISGSGKSSLVFGTLYQEGKRKYIESLNFYSRKFLGNFEKPDVDQIEGLCPAINIKKGIISYNPRSTVGTMTEIYDYLSLLYANISIPQDPETKQSIKNQNLEEIMEQILKFELNSKIFILAPIVEKEKGTHQKILKKFFKKGFDCFIIDQKKISLENDFPSLEKDQYHDIYIVIDRIEINNNKERLCDSLNLAFSLVPDKVFISQEEKIHKFYRNYYSSEKKFIIPKREIRLFSFNNTHGICQSCQGLGVKNKLDPNLIICLYKSINEGGIIPYFYYQNVYSQIHDLKTFCQHNNIDMDTPLKKLNPKLLNILLYGKKENLKNNNFDPLNSGVINILEHFYHQKNDPNNINWFINFFVSEQKCDSCSGARLNEKALLFKIQNHNIYELSKLSIKELLDFFLNLKLTDEEKKISDLILQGIIDRLHFLKDIGLDYLTLERCIKTLSDGEIQRIRLANQIGAKLSGILYTLDEPSIGLHPKDNEKLIKALKTIRNLGNTLLVIEHDPQTMLSADYLIEIGPQAGEQGGQIIAYGTPEEIIKNKKSLTGQYLSGEKIINVPKKRNPINPQKIIQIRNVSENNLKNINVDFPLEILTVITGVSGSGKSTLLNQILKSNIPKKNSYHKNENISNTFLNKYNSIKKIIKIISSPIGTKTKSNLITYTKIFDYIRNLFASTTEAKLKGYTKSHFSFNNKKGYCEHCSGLGIKKFNMNFLPDVSLKCAKCKGQKFNKEILKIKYKNKNIAEILDMTVNEALIFFNNFTFIKNHFQILKEIGLDYIRLGQNFKTLSDGELQKIKLANEFAKTNVKNTLYILDEPTIGLHSEDVKKLIKIIHHIIKQKATVIMIEHNLDIIKNADYIIDLGPEGGNNGGYIIAKGTPEEIMQKPQSFTGQYLKKNLNIK